MKLLVYLQLYKNIYNFIYIKISNNIYIIFCGWGCYQDLKPLKKLIIWNKIKMKTEMYKNKCFC